jgi:enoyl-CoA hydratase/carnithine racemase
MAAGSLTYRKGAPFGEIILDAPKRRNAISAAMWAALADAAAEAEKDAGARVVVVRGAGGHFAAGADISEFERVYKTPADAERYTTTMLAALAALEALPKPTLALVRGACVGGGTSIALACDLRFAAPSARFGVTPGKLGLVYSLEDTRRLAAAVGAAAAKELLFSGRLVAGEEAAAIGLADRLYAEEEIDDAALAFARLVEETAPSSARATKEMFRLLKAGAADGDARASALMAASFASADFREGYRAFLEKRRPKFPGA